MIVLFLLFFCFWAQAFVELNDIVPVFSEKSQLSIENAVIQGAVHFLQAQSQASLLLAEYEKSGQQPFNFPAALTLTDKSITEIEKALDRYNQAATIGKQTGYINGMIQKCKNFDYNSFASEKSMNSDIMVMVKAYFCQGNIVGIYRQYVEYLGDILINLNLIREKLSQNIVPEISMFWQLVQQFSKAALFGNYCTITAQTVLVQ